MSRNVGDRGCPPVLTANLARSRTRDGTVSPLLIDPDDQQYRETARELIQIFEDHLGEPKGELKRDDRPAHRRGYGL